MSLNNNAHVWAKNFFTKIKALVPVIAREWPALLVASCLLLAAFRVQVGPQQPQRQVEPIMVTADSPNALHLLNETTARMIAEAEKQTEKILEATPTLTANPKPRTDKVPWEFLQKKYGDKYDSLLRHWTVFVAEERATGVPAELTAAQYLLESDAGKSWLAKNGRNLYGFKAGHYNKKQKRWVMYDWVDGQQGVVWRKDDCYCDGKEVPCPFVDFKSQFWSIRAKSKLTLRKFKPDSSQVVGFEGREWRAWVDRLAPATEKSKQYRKRKSIPNYATSETYFNKILKIIHDWKLYAWPKV